MSHSNLPKLGGGLVAILLALVAARFALNRQEKPAITPKVVAENKWINPHSYRPIIPAEITTTTKLVRLEKQPGELLALNDLGEALYLTNAPNPPAPEYAFVSGAKIHKSGKIPANQRWHLLKGGGIRTSIEKYPRPFTQSPVGGGQNGDWPFNELTFFRRSNDVNQSIAQSSTIKLDSAPFDWRKEKVLEVCEDERSWLREEKYKDRGTDPTFQFLVWSFKGKIGIVPMPKGYVTVDRLAETGPIVAASFGDFVGDQPVRSFIKQETGWKESPIPKGYDFSFVQRVFHDGLILGMITDKNLSNMKQIVWDGDKVSILNDLPGWPKTGQYSFVLDVDRNGDILVRNILNSQSGTSDDFLMHVSRQ